MTDIKMLEKLPPWQWPEEAGLVLLGILQNKGSSAPERILAAELAGDLTVINDEIARALFAIVQSQEEIDDLRVKAAISLGPALDYADVSDFDDPDDMGISGETFDEIADGLRILFQNQHLPDEVRRAVLEASVRAPDDWHRTAVQTAYESQDHAWHLTAVFCMQYVSGFDNEILEALESGEPELEYHAVRGAGNWSLDEAWPHIRYFLTSESTDKQMLIAAIEAAGVIRPEEAIDLMDDIPHLEDEDIAEAVMELQAIADTIDFMDEDDWEEDDEWDEEGEEEKPPFH
jgi:hypothetical protein